MILAKRCTASIVFLFSIAFIYQLQAQDKIQVLDKILNSPIEDVNVVTSQKITATNKGGFFSLKNLSPISLTDSIIFSCIGYTTYISTLGDIKEDNYTVYLSPKSELIDEVTVVTDKQLKESLDFEVLSPMKEGVYAFSAALVGDSIFVIGGDMSVRDGTELEYEYEHNTGKIQIYDIQQDKWRVSDTRLSNRAYHNAHYYDGRIFIFGGKRLAKNKRLELLNNQVEVYNIKNDTVYSSESNPHQAVNFASGLYKGNIIVMNGSIKKYDYSHKITKQAHLFNLRTGYWYQLEDIPCSYETTGIAIDNLLYQIGGLKQRGVAYLNVYNIDNGKHHTECVFPLYLERPDLAYNKDTHTLYLYEHSTLFAYSLLTKEMLAYKVDLDLMYSQMIYKDQNLYIIGGQKVVKIDKVKANGDNREYETKLMEMPSDGLYRIDLKEFELTKSHKVSSL